MVKKYFGDMNLVKHTIKYLKQMKKMQKLMTNATHDPAQAAQLATLPAHEQAKLTAQMLRQALEWAWQPKLHNGAEKRTSAFSSPV